MDIVLTMLEKGANDYNKSMLAAAKGGHLDIIRLMMTRGATNYDEVMRLHHNDQN
jgi:hypothetical protein